MAEDRPKPAPEIVEDPLDLLGTGKQNLKLSAEQKKQFDRDDADMKDTLSRASGRRMLFKQLGRCGIFRASFTANSNQTAFHEGQRDIGLGLLQEINRADINAFAQMQREHISEAKSKETK